MYYASFSFNTKFLNFLCEIHSTIAHGYLAMCYLISKLFVGFPDFSVLLIPNLIVMVRKHSVYDSYFLTIVEDYMAGIWSILVNVPRLFWDSNQM